MLIAHISDTHLGFTQYGISAREEDFYRSFSEAIEIIIKEHVDLVIHSGDIFDTPRPNGTAIVRLLDELKRLEDNNIKFVFVLGEHDISRLRSIPVPILYNKIKLAYHLYNKAISINDLSIIGYRKHRLHEIHLLKEELSKINLEAKKKILVLHQGLKEFHEPAGELTHLDLPTDFDYYAFGHLHEKNHKWFDGFKGPVYYPGSTEITKFEQDLEKGFYLVDLSREADVNWIKLETREHIIEDLEDNERLEEYINSLIDILAKKDKPVLKLRFNDIDTIKARSIIRRLEEYALHIVTEYNRYYKIQDRNKPVSIDEEMLKRSESILGSKDKARFAIIELLPALLNRDGALELLWSAYKNNRFG